MLLRHKDEIFKTVIAGHKCDDIPMVVSLTLSRLDAQLVDGLVRVVQAEASRFAHRITSPMQKAPDHF